MFAVWSDKASAIALIWSNGPDGPSGQLTLTVDSERQHTFVGLLDGVGAGLEYELRVDGARAVDPYARCLPHDPRDPCAAARLGQFAVPGCMRNAALATREQVAALHQAFDGVLRGPTRASRQALGVVVIGDHQARARSLGMQYFERRFRGSVAADERVTYGENLHTEAEALALVRTRRLDKVIAKAFFGDEQRLQRGVLGDAAMRCLHEMSLESIT